MNPPDRTKTRDLQCPECLEPLVDVRSVTPDATPEYDDIFLCGKCACVSTYGLFTLTKMSKEDFDKMHPDEQKDLNFAIRNCVALALVKNKDAQLKLQNFFSQN